MDKNKVEIIAILDRSGSMQGKEIDTIGGYNSLIEKQKKLKKDVCVTLVLFDSNNPCEVVYENKKINDVPILDSNTYFARGCTPLLDAIGKSIVSVNERYKNASATEVPANVICLIITDGLENDSKEYKREQIKKLVENQKDKFN